MKTNNKELHRVSIVLSERLKELECLYTIMNILNDPEKTPDNVFQQIVQRLPMFWTHSDIASAHISLDSMEFQSEHFNKTPWMQSAKIQINDKTKGIIELSYSEERPEKHEGPFLEYERKMLDAVSLQLSQYYHRISIEKKLLEYMDNLQETIETKSSDLTEVQEKLHRHEKLALIGQLAGGVGHDLRNPIGAIKNTVYFLNMALEDPDPDIRESLEILNSEVENADNILRTLLDFARPRPPEFQKCVVQDCIDKAVQQAKIADSVSVEIKVSEELPEFDADPFQIQRVLVNLIKNAQQAMQGEGGITISSLYSKETDMIEIIVADTGPGIPKDKINTIFEPLVTTKSKGVGLGLSIVKSLIERHNGSIDIESESGKGCRFLIKLPLCQNGDIADE